MKKYLFKKIDAFATAESGGNPAGTVWLESLNGISHAEMLQIARELKGFVSEVGYIHKIEDGNRGILLQRGRILIVRKSGCYTNLKQSERAAFLYGIRSYRIQIDDCFPIFYLNLYCLYCFSRSEVENYGTYICRIFAPRRFLKNSFDDNI